MIGKELKSDLLTALGVNEQHLDRIVSAIQQEPHEIFIIEYWYFDDKDSNDTISAHTTLIGAKERAHALCVEQYDECMSDIDSSYLMTVKHNYNDQPVYEITTKNGVVLESWTILTTTLEK